MALSAYLAASAVGMLLGGVLADRLPCHARIAGAGLALAAFSMALIGTGVLPFSWVIGVVALAGVCFGVTTPSRDILVKGSAPAGAIGRVFGVVYSGGDVAFALASLGFGALADHHAFSWIFACIAGFFVMGIFTVTAVGRRQVR